MSDWRQEALDRVFERMQKKDRVSKAQILSAETKGFITSGKATEIEARLDEAQAKKESEKSGVKG